MRYIEWAKAHDYVKHSLGWSFAPYRSFESLAEDFQFDWQSVSLNPRSDKHRHSLRTLIAEHFMLPTEQVLPTASCTLANFLALAAVMDLVDEGKREVIIETPTYSPLIQQIRASGGSVRTVATWRDGRNRPESLRQAITSKTALVVLTNPNNPTGSVTAPDELAEICDRAANHGAYVLVDEVYRGFIDPEAIAPAAQCGPNAICTESLSKVFGLANLKVGWILGPPPVVKRATQIYDHLGVEIPFLSQQVALQVLGNHWHKITDEAREFANSRRRIVEDFFAQRDDVVWHNPDGGLVGLLEPVHLEAGDIAETMIKDHETVVVPGRFFGVPNVLRLGFGGPKLEANLERLGQVLDGMAAG